MGKSEKGTPKDIANRMKAKGLQKLRWYCQMCQKQCRDENGFKCHTTSEGHQRQLLLFAEDPDRYLDSFSEEFLEGYMSLLKRRFGTKRVHANNVYQEYIHDRDHVHMNATKWETLTEFVKWLGREGLCVVDETEKGWFVAWVDRDPETVMRHEQKQRREKFEKDEEERFQEFINRQVEQGKAREGKNLDAFTELKREEDDVPISLALKVNQKIEKTNKPESSLAANPLKIGVSILQKEKGKKDSSAHKKRSVLEELIEEDKQRQKRFKERSSVPESRPQPSSSNPKAPWLAIDIIVKVVTKELGSKYYKAKGIVKEIIDEYAAIVKLLDCGTKLKLDQEHLETVIPSIGRKVVILTGKHKGSVAILKEIKVEQFCACLEIYDGPQKGRFLADVPYEDFSKLNT